MDHTESGSKSRTESESRASQKGYWFRVENAVLDRICEIGKTPFLVYCALARHANKKRQAWPGINSIAERVGVKPRNVKKAIKTLQDHRLIRKENRSKASGAYDTNVYTLLTVPPVDQVTLEAPSPVDQVTLEAPGEVTLEAPGEVTLEAPLTRTTEQDSLNNSPSSPPTGDTSKRKKLSRANRAAQKRQRDTRAQNAALPEKTPGVGLPPDWRKCIKKSREDTSDADGS